MASLSHSRTPSIHSAVLTRLELIRYNLPMKLFADGDLEDNIYTSEALSDLDKAFLILNYPRQKPHHGAEEWTLAKALEVAEVKGEARSNILSRLEKPDDIRQQFLEWKRASSVQVHLMLEFGDQGVLKPGETHRA